MSARRWPVRRWAREYADAYVEALHFAEMWLPPLRWHLDLYRACLALRDDS